MDVSDEEDDSVIAPAAPTVAKPKDTATKTARPKQLSAPASKSASKAASKAAAAKPASKGASAAKAASKQKPPPAKKHPKPPKPRSMSVRVSKQGEPCDGDGDHNNEDDEDDSDEPADFSEEDEGGDDSDDSDDSDDEDESDDEDDGDDDDKPLSKKRSALEVAERIVQTAKKAKRSEPAKEASASPAAATVTVAEAGGDGEDESNTGMAKTFSLLEKTASSMQEVFPSAVCIAMRVEAERIKRQLLNPTKPAEDVLHETIAKIIKSVAPHITHDSGVSASSLAVANAASEGLHAAADAFHLMLSAIKPLEERAMTLRDAVHESSEKMQAVYGELFR